MLITEIHVYDALEKTTTTLAVEQLADTRFRALENDMFDARLTFGMEFETTINESGAHEVLRITKASEYTTWRFCLSPRYKESEYRLLGDEVMRQGGFWQVDLGIFAIVNLPPHSPFDLPEIFRLFGLEPPELVA
ncbi:hypothetical protein [Hymenobacter guriensis]|uniref:Uncharacterized protein n=1 Tax=Hymenobacter guriensis TaxID=2793065 RepID=A0ABS0L933_9BACT|nr:hypothetical protein [Hymenobacter guriensis]MBG8555989.1 hypothetical protein [Hymenobacter guriensis]